VTEPVREDVAFYEDLERRYQSSDYLMSRRLQIVVKRVRAGRRLLDIGAGSGIASRRLADRFERVVALDRNSNALGFLHALFPSHPTVSVVRGDGYDLGFSDHAFDCCLLLDILEHVSNPQRILGEVWRCLVPGGQVFVSTPNWMDLISCKVLRLNPYHVTFHTPWGWKVLMERAGFRVTLSRAIRFPIIDADVLARRLQLLGMGVIIEAFKPQSV
jgi:2-polyprenyl-3-methyl-5-hydroxy-6-metoxy-1,4-benzoquinol methylase